MEETPKIKKTRQRRYASYKDCLFIRKFPPQVKEDFKEFCRQRELTMREEIIRMCKQRVKEATVIDEPKGHSR